MKIYIQKGNIVVKRDEVADEKATYNPISERHPNGPQWQTEREKRNKAGRHGYENDCALNDGDCFEKIVQDAIAEK